MKMRYTRMSCLFVCVFYNCHKNDLNYKLNILGPLCLWQCFFYENSSVLVVVLLVRWEGGRIGKTLAIKPTERASFVHTSLSEYSPPDDQ